jgi:hypothetical protein
MSGQRLQCDACGWSCEAEKGMTLDDAHTCPAPPPGDARNDWTFIWRRYPAGPPAPEGRLPAIQVTMLADRTQNPTLTEAEMRTIIRALAQEVVMHRYHDCDRDQGGE